jgi:uncharacterized protein (DUF58 family)
MSTAAGWRDRLRARRPFWSIHPTPRAAWVVLCLAPLWLLPVGSAVAGAAGLVVVVTLLALDYALLPGRRHVVVRRTAPATVGFADTMQVEWALESAWPRATEVEVHHQHPAAIEVDTPPRRRLAGGQHVVIATEGAATVRGRHRLGDLAVRVTTPLGLLRRTTRLQDDASLLVVPSLSDVRRFRLLALQHRLGQVGIRALRLRGEGRAFAGLRDYVPGDDPRLVDWKATARHRRLISREFTVERSQNVVIMVDCGRAMTQQAGRWSRLEHVLSAAVLLTDVAAASGDHVGLLAFDTEPRTWVQPQRSALRAVRNAVTGLGAVMAEPDYGTAFRLLALRQRKRSLVVFFTDVMDARSSRSLVSYVARSAVRHAVIVVAIRNDELMAAATPASDAPDVLYASAAAEELVRERAAALEAMRRAGVTVLDVSAPQMTVAVVNRYLEVKARGLL